MAKQAYVLLEGASAGTTGSSFTVPKSGWYVLRVFGTFGGTTFTLETNGDTGSNSAWITVADATQTSAWAGRVYLERAAEVRGKATGGTGVSLNATLNPE